MQTVSNRVAALLGIEYPIVQAPMNFIAGHALAAAVSRAGGMGVLSLNASKVQGESLGLKERLIREFARVREVTDKPVGMNIVLPDGDNLTALRLARTLVDIGIEAGASAVFCVGGLQPALFEKIKKSGMKLVVRSLTPTVRHARDAQEMGADAVIVTGADAGGVLPAHRTGTFTILPAVADAVSIPILAAGGINDLRAVRAAFCLGAEGVYVGTRFIASDECAANAKTKELVCRLSGANLLEVDETLRSLPTEFAAEAYVKHRLQPGAPSSIDTVAAMRKGMYDGDPDEGLVSVNTGIDVIRSVVPAARIVGELMADFVRGRHAVQIQARAQDIDGHA